MDMLGESPRIDLEKWDFRTNLDHREIRDHEPLLVGANAHLENSLVYNGCKIDGTVRNSILFPGVHVAAGAVVENSVIFFKNTIARDCRLHKVISDVNNLFERGVSIGTASAISKPVTVVGWNNSVPPGIHIGEGARIYPHLSRVAWPSKVEAGEVVR
jgi:glucose-1-phosphate adenylyltransferase